MAHPTDEEKKRLRRRMSELRAGVDEPARRRAAERVKANFLDAMTEMGLPCDTAECRAAFAGYWPKASELDPRPLLVALDGRGYACALPVVVGRRQPLRFRRWSPGMALEPASFGLREPPETASEISPDVILAPLLAFDLGGNRLGYGAGFYDRTLERLRQHCRVLAVGVAYAFQCVDAVPFGSGDQPLEWVVTDEGVRRSVPS
ncbi:MAG: 5-formyltetrahydrofolate cyclo-ligase [Rhodospirillales bacterium]|jgi:5-formyltetrahydrofolate cyclo-ligase|nr:5-formyltetrahydrofolate cyclo-ligase [Rhodospirillales bacterium]MDP6805576.1 5-formyltetrahydrofolate cyclo-ligase [Rhodospirillales bacterium]